MAEFTNEFELARNFGFDITMPDGNMGLTSAAHMEYMHKCTALYKNFMYNMNNIIRFEKDTKKHMSKLHREKMANLRFSLYRSENDASGNDPFARKLDDLSASFTGLDSRMNTPWGLGDVPDEGDEEEVTRPHTAPALCNTKKRGHTDDNLKEGRTSANKENEETVSMTGLSDLGTVQDETNKVVLGVIDTKTEKKIVVGHQSFAKLGHNSVKVKLKNRDGMFTVRPLRNVSDDNTFSVKAYQPNKSDIDYDPVTEKMAMVKQQTSYLTPTIASDMKINNRIPIQKSLKGLESKRTTIVEIYRNARDRTSRHIRIVTKKPKSESVLGQSRSSRLSFVRTKIQSMQAFQSPLRNRPSLLTPDVTDAPTTPIPRSPSRVAFAGDDTGFPLTPEMRGRSDTMSSIGNQLKPSEMRGKSDIMSSIGNQLKPHEMRGRTDTISPVGNQNNLPEMRGRSDTVSSIGNTNRPEMRGRSDTVSSIGNTNRPEMRGRSDTMSSTEIPNKPPDGTPKAGMGRRFSFCDIAASMMGRTPSISLGLQADVVPTSPLTDPDANQNTPQRKASIVSTLSAAIFINKLKNAAGVGNAPPPGFSEPKKIVSRSDTQKMIKQQQVKDNQLDDNMNNWRRRMAMRPSVSSKSKGRVGDRRLKLI